MKNVLVLIILIVAVACFAFAAYVSVDRAAKLIAAGLALVALALTIDRAVLVSDQN